MESKWTYFRRIKKERKVVGPDKAVWYLQVDWIVPEGILSKQWWFLGNDFSKNVNVTCNTLSFPLKIKLEADLKHKDVFKELNLLH